MSEGNNRARPKELAYAKTLGIDEPESYTKLVLSDLIAIAKGSGLKEVQSYLALKKYAATAESFSSVLYMQGQRQAKAIGRVEEIYFDQEKKWAMVHFSLAKYESFMGQICIDWNEQLLIPLQKISDMVYLSELKAEELVGQSKAEYEQALEALVFTSQNEAKVNETPKPKVNQITDQIKRGFKTLFNKK
ncbi:hypothetical protein PQO03_04650 [Lentisphaera profundi]|uniref:Uncharacterized protein n=1 Tax=Lentisphaera profundi TaxID=1658616 RepID=A0ABY7VWQ0_9BACT|nr:hypothetical protein [Lentisphaera profundi]WDE97241.1 hypothetical protein PQO03_04650 [Lentisphaera profundi]